MLDNNMSDDAINQNPTENVEQANNNEFDNAKQQFELFKKSVIDLVMRVKLLIINNNLEKIRVLFDIRNHKYYEMLLLVKFNDCDDFTALEYSMNRIDDGPGWLVTNNIMARLNEQGVPNYRGNPNTLIKEYKISYEEIKSEYLFYNLARKRSDWKKILNRQLISKTNIDKRIADGKNFVFYPPKKYALIEITL